MLARLLSGIGLCFALSMAAAATASISPDGMRLANQLDRTRVDELWPAGVHVSWETGEPDGRSEKAEGKHTHCSAFVAAEAKKFGIYLLRPPEHGQVLLANAQYDWLADEGAAKGWQAVQGGIEAQQLANRGYFVVATYRNRKDNKPGHIAIVRPSDKSASQVAAEGPQITQAGGTNYISAPLKRGFAGHPAAFARAQVRYYAHAIDWKNVR